FNSTARPARCLRQAPHLRLRPLPRQHTLPRQHHPLRRTGAFPISRQRKGALRLILSPPALEIQGSVGVRSLPIAPATSIPVLVAERWPSTTRIPIPQLARQRFCSTSAASKTPPLEPTRWPLTAPPAATLLSAALRSIIMTPALRTRPSVSTPSLPI